MTCGKRENTILLNRSIWVDYAKGIGIILVVFGHVEGGIFSAGFKYDQKTHYILQSIIGSFHMPLFFFLSGLFFFSSLNKRGEGGLFKNKIETILYPYIIWCVVDGGIGVALSSYTNRNNSVSDLLSFLWVPYSHLWFLYALFFIFVISIFLYTRLPKQFYVSILIVSIILYLFGRDIPQIVPLNLISNYLVFFVFGINFFHIKDLFSKYIHILFPLSLLTFLLCQWYFHFKLELLIINNAGLLTLLLALVSIAFVVTTCILLQHIQLRVLLTIGRSSLGIYLMHVIAGSGIRIILHKYFGIDDISTHLILGTLAGITFPIFALLFFEFFNVRFLFEPSSRLKRSIQL